MEKSIPSKGYTVDKCKEVRKSMLWELQPTGFDTSQSWTTSGGHPGKADNVSLLYNILLTYLVVTGRK